MRRLLSIGTIITISLSVSACARNNTAYDNNKLNPNTSIGQNRNTVRRISQRNITNSPISTSNNWSDGVYTGEGNSHPNGNETAVVTVKNGRIAFITLKSLDNTGKNRLQNFTTNTNMSNNPAIIKNTGQNIPNNTTTPNSTIRNTGRTNYANNTGTIDNYGTTGNTGNLTNMGSTNNAGNLTNMGSTNNTGFTSNTGNTNTTGFKNQVTTSLDTMRSKLVRAMMKNQTYDVAAPTTDGTLLNTASNWKLAVQRAIQKASR